MYDYYFTVNGNCKNRFLTSQKDKLFFGITNIRTIEKALGQALFVYQNKIPNVSTALHFCLRFILQN